MRHRLCALFAHVTFLPVRGWQEFWPASVYRHLGRPHQAYWAIVWRCACGERMSTGYPWPTFWHSS